MTDRTPAPRPTRSRDRRGYTLVEVAAALAVLTIGAAGVVSAQKVAAVGNANARNVAAASTIANAWAERLHADGVTWIDAASLASTRWLVNVDGPTLTVLEGTAGWGAERADVTGTDIYNGAQDQNTPAFCTTVTLTTIYPDLISATVQVFWDKQNNPVDCTQTPKPGYGIHTLITSIRQNTVVTG